jgi:hypothetical protein
MAAIGSEFVVISRHFQVLLNAAAVLEAEPEIVCAVRVSSLGGALLANPKTVLRRGVSLASRQAVVFRRLVQIFANIFALLETAPDIEERIRMTEQHSSPAMSNGALNVWIDAIAALQAAAEAVYTIRVTEIRRLLETLSSGSEIWRNAAACLQAPANADGTCGKAIAASLVISH